MALLDTSLSQFHVHHVELAQASFASAGIQAENLRRGSNADKGEEQTSFFNVEAELSRSSGL